MRTTYPGTLATFLNTGAPYREVELLTIMLQSGTVVRLCTNDVDLVVSSNTFSHGPPTFTRGRVQHRRGLQVSEMSLRIHASIDNEYRAGVPWIKAIRSGAFDYAKVRLDIGVISIEAPVEFKGYYNWFVGSIADIPSITASSIEMKLKNAAQRLDVLMPRNLVQPGCLNTLFDDSCTLSKAGFTVSGAVTTVHSVDSYTIDTALTTDAFNEGQIVVTSGDNLDVVKKIKNNVGSRLYLFAPFETPLTIGTTVDVTQGCNKTRARCDQLGNGPNFRGMRFVPTPETLL